MLLYPSVSDPFTFLQEMLGACVRVVGDDLSVKKRLVRLRMLDGPINNLNISAEIVDIIMQVLKISNRVRVCISELFAV